MSKKMKIVSIVMIVVAVIVIVFCGFYLINSSRLIRKYDGTSFKLGKYEIPTFNSAQKKKKKLVLASEKDGAILLKYDIKDMKLNDVYAYLEKLSKEGYTVVNLEDLYIRTINSEKNIQVKINVGSKHLILEYKTQIDITEKTDEQKKSEKETKPETNETNKEQS